MIEVAAWLQAGGSNTVFTGAGISTESGIPDFRSPNVGRWSAASPVLFQDFLTRRDSREEYWRQKSESHDQMLQASPNVAHQILVDWEQRGLLSRLVTQNIDGLHKQAGSRRLLEIHGNAMEVACTSGCGFRAESEPYVRSFLHDQTVPLCPGCEGFLKHATISFGQSLLATDIETAVRWAETSNVFLALGSSLLVTPAADLPRLAKANGAQLVIINREPTPLDDLADLVIHAELGFALSSIDDVLAAS
jgi:NAD-dependent deacetylase